jgi:hypothetical protein
VVPAVVPAVAPVVLVSPVVGPVDPASSRVVLQDLRYLSQEQGIPRSATPLDLAPAYKAHPASPSQEAAALSQEAAGKDYRLVILRQALSSMEEVLPFPQALECPAAVSKAAAPVCVPVAQTSLTLPAVGGLSYHTLAPTSPAPILCQGDRGL